MYSHNFRLKIRRLCLYTMISLLHGTTMGCKRKSPAVMAKKEALKPKEINRKEPKPVSGSTVSETAALSSKRKSGGSSADKPKSISANSKKNKMAPKPIVEDDKRTKAAPGSNTGTLPLNERKTNATVPITSEPIAKEDKKNKAATVSNDDAPLSSDENPEAELKATPLSNPVAPVIPPYNKKLVDKDTDTKPPVALPRNKCVNSVQAVTSNNMSHLCSGSNGVDPSHGQTVIAQNIRATNNAGDTSHLRSGSNCPDLVHQQTFIPQNTDMLNVGEATNNSAQCQFSYPPVVLYSTTTKPFHQQVGFSYGMQMPSQGFLQSYDTLENHAHQVYLQPETSNHQYKGPPPPYKPSTAEVNYVQVPTSRASFCTRY